MIKDEDKDLMKVIFNQSNYKLISFKDEVEKREINIKTLALLSNSLSSST